MWPYVLRRLILIPVTLFFIILVNFVIINLAPGEPTSITEISPEGGASRRNDRGVAFGSDTRYLQFRERYGLTLPVLFNTWPWINLKTVKQRLWQLQHRHYGPDQAEISVKDYDKMRIRFGDQARFIMPHLLQVIADRQTDPVTLSLAVRFFARGGTRQGFVGSTITDQQKALNKKIAENNLFLLKQIILPTDTQEQIEQKVAALKDWYKANAAAYQFEPTFWQKVKIFFFQTRFFRTLAAF